MQEDVNRKKFLTMLMIALSEKEPLSSEFKKVKHEMARLAIVGESIIILCQKITFIFSGKKTFTEKDLEYPNKNAFSKEKL